MKSDARLLLNNKKWKKSSNSSQADKWKSRGGVDARKILNQKRRQQPKAPVIGSYMRAKSATALIASQIRQEISSVPKVPNKQVELSNDGNIIITSKLTNAPANIGRSQIGFVKDLTPRSRIQENRMQCEPSASSYEDLEHTGIEDLLDLESLPPAYVSSNTLQKANLSRNSVINQVVNRRHTMVADQMSQRSSPQGVKVYVKNLHPTVSWQDVVELFGDVGAIKSAEILRPGNAVIEYFSREDAFKACEVYHNRLLDGLPMKCQLTNEIEAERSPIVQRLGNRLDIHHLRSMQSTASPAMFSNPRSRYMPRNVQFTVKLT